TGFVPSVEKVGAGTQRNLQALHVFLARDLDRPEALRVRIEKLDVEELKAALLETVHQIRQRDLGSVPLPREHGFAREKTINRNSVNAARQFAAAPNLDAMPIAELVQPLIRLAHVGCNPVPFAGPVRAAVENSLKITVDCSIESAGTDGSPQPPGDVQPAHLEDGAGVRRPPQDGNALIIPGEHAAP